MSLQGSRDLPCRSHLSAWLSMVTLWVQRYMRLYPDRLVQADGTYSDQCVSPQELRRLLGLAKAEEASAWVDAVGVRPLPQIERRLRQQHRELQDWMLSLEPGAWLPLEELRAGFMLEEEELHLLLAAAAPRISMDLARLYPVAWGDFARREPTVGFLAELVAGSHLDPEALVDRLGPEGALTRHRLLEVDEAPQGGWQGPTPLLHRRVIVPQRVLDFLRGARRDASGHLHGTLLVEQGPAPGELVIEPELRQGLTVVLRRPQARVALVGAPGSGRRTLAQSFILAGGRRVLRVQLRSLLASSPEPPSARLALALREARLFGAVPVLTLDGLEDKDSLEGLRAIAEELRALLEELPGALFLVSQKVDLVKLLVPDVVLLSVVPPPKQGQEILWRRALSPLLSPPQVELISAELARSYKLSPGGIQRAVEVASHAESKGAGVTLPALLRSIQRQFDHRLGWLASLVTVELGLDGVVLSPELRQQVDEILQFARHREQVFDQWRFRERSPGGVGMSVLFSGPPGTGKTLLASVLARELGRAMYRVDLSRVVDKYIGETEKNLGRIFDEAERAQAMLLFDEADSLFAKRTQVKSSHDRYANLEVNYLLQRLEAFEGMSILTTNLALSFDEAFLRRIRFKLTLALPEAQERAALWRGLMPPAAPVARDIDWEELAETFVFSGGHIKNAVLRAAIEAASQGSAINHEILLQAGLSESREMGMLIRI